MNIHYDFTDKVALVVGGADGMGLATSELLAASGAKVIVADFNEKKGQRVVKELQEKGYQATFILTDIRDKKSVFGLISKTVALWGHIDYAANVAGIFGKADGAKFYEKSDEDYDDVMDTNLRGHWWLLQAQTEQMVKQGGSGYAIVEVSSIQGLIGTASGAAYTAAKHAVVGLVKSLGAEFATQGIRINGIAPVATATPLIKSHWEQLGHEFSNKTDRVPRGTMLEPEECAHAIVWLLSDGASAMNATTIAVDGGATAIR